MAGFLGRLRPNQNPTSQQPSQPSPTLPSSSSTGGRTKSPITPTSSSLMDTEGSTISGGGGDNAGYFDQQNQNQNQNQNQTQKPLYLCQPFVKAALVKGSFKTIVAPPKYVDVNEWVAINIFDFFNNLNHFYAVITEFCSVQSCPAMGAARELNFTWPDQNKRQVSLPAPTYIDYVMSWVQKLLDDESVFPTKSGRDFPPSFPSTAKHIYKQLFRIFSHIYHAHFVEILHLSVEAHFNSLFAHFVAFGKEYDLLDASDLRDLKARGGGVVLLAEKWSEMGILEG